MPRKKYVQFSGWAVIGAALSRAINAWSEWRVRPPRGGLERGLWLERNEDET